MDNDPIGIAIADLNGDGILDLAIAIYGPPNNSQGEVAILIGAGDGTFAPAVYYPLTHNGVRIVATDLNHDGKLDLAVALQHFSNEKNALAVLLGNGDGTFQPVVTSVSGSGDDVAAADFDGDGNVDLALAGDGYLRVLLGKGDGTFQPAVAYSPGEAFTDTVAIADLNRDGVPDLIAGGDQTVIFLGNGDGTFGLPVVYGVGERFARIGYFNRDQDPDLVAGGGFSAIGVALGKGDGTLRAPVILPYDLNSSGLASADFDGDGHADLVVSADQILFLRGLGDGTFAPAVPIANLGAFYLIATDLNGDGKSDLLITQIQSGFYTLLGNGDGTFQAAQFTPLVFGWAWPVVADFNKDGQADIAVTSEVADEFAILLGRGDGTFDPATYYQTDKISHSPTPADFNGDGNIDLAICVSASNVVAIYPGNGDGTLASPLTLDTFDPLYSAVSDFNQDGKRIYWSMAATSCSSFSSGMAMARFRPRKRSTPTMVHCKWRISTRMAVSISRSYRS